MRLLNVLEQGGLNRELKEWEFPEKDRTVITLKPIL